MADPNKTIETLSGTRSDKLSMLLVFAMGAGVLWIFDSRLSEVVKSHARSAAAMEQLAVTDREELEIMRELVDALENR